MRFDSCVETVKVLSRYQIVLEMLKLAKRLIITKTLGAQTMRVKL